jgi:hypothetical protein
MLIGWALYWQQVQPHTDLKAEKLHRTARMQVFRRGGVCNHSNGLSVNEQIKQQ